MNEKRTQLAGQYMRLYRLLMRHLMVNHAHSGINPHKGQGRVLAILKMQPEIGQKELGYLLDMSKQALAELLSKLEKNGYITRTQSEKDRRSFIIKLTDKGREAIPEDTDETDDIGIEELFACLSDEEQSNLSNYLKRIIETAEKHTDTDEDDYAEFFRQRFFARHGKHGHGEFHGGFEGFDPRKWFGFGGKDDDSDE